MTGLKSQIHTRNVRSGVQGGQLAAQLVLRAGIDAPSIVATAAEEFLQPFVPGALDQLPFSL